MTKEFTRRSTIAAFALILITTLTYCVGVAEDQQAYDACTPSHNNTFLSLPDHKAIVSGVSAFGSRCYWRSNAASSDDASNAAMSDCHADYDRCFLYSTDIGNQPWVQAISDNGGLTQSTIDARQQQQEMNEALGAFFQGFAGARGVGGFSTGSSSASNRGSIPAAAASGCEAANNRLLSEIQQVQSQARGMGICQSARTLANIYQQAANLLRRCPTLDPTGTDAAAYDQGANQALQTADASCAQ